MPDLNETLANWKSEAQALRRRGQKSSADLLDSVAEDLEKAAPQFLTWLTEKEALTKSGLQPKWFKLRFAQWLDQGLARLEGKERLYLDAVVPQRKHGSAIRESARRAAHGDHAA